MGYSACMLEARRSLLHWLLVVALALWLTPLERVGAQSHPCAVTGIMTVGPPEHQHREHAAARTSARWTRPVSDCGHADCAAGQHCATAGVVVLLPDAAFLLVPTHAARPDTWVSDQLLSTNPTPPNPPPQPVL
jgi:hypothetical protein